MGIGAAAVMPLMPAGVAEAARQAVAARRHGAPLTFFTPAQHRTVDVLAELIIPADDRSPGAHANVRRGSRGRRAGFTRRSRRAEIAEVSRCGRDSSARSA